MTSGTPSAEIDVDAPLVRRLLRAQHPDLAELALARVDDGWDNVMFRLGDDLAIRLPRRAMAAPLVVNEQRWLGELAPRLPIRIPAPVRVGVPGNDYPWCWSIVPWLPGRAADLAAPRPKEAVRLAEFLRSLHHPAPMDAPANGFRGVPLWRRADAVEDRIGRLAASTRMISDAVTSIWKQALAAPAATEARWLHGDLHPRNVLVDDGAIAAVIDWGDVTSGDPATDLAAFWMLFDDARVRDGALRRYGNADPALRARARGWAVLFGVVLLDSGMVDDARHAEVGRATLRRLTEEVMR